MALHRFLVDVAGFIVEDEYPAGPYSIDCYAEEVHAGFEYDGKDFHDTTKRRRRDSERDEWILEELGIPIMRVKDADLLRGNQEALFCLLQEWVDSHGNITERRKLEKRHK